MTAAEVVLVSMLKLEENTGLDHFDHDAIVVECWRTDSGKFGMKSFAYPDSKRVSMEIVKMAKGPNLKRCETRRYQLTETGREKARTLKGSKK